MKRAFATTLLLSATLWTFPAIAAPMAPQATITDTTAVMPVATYVCRRDERGWHHMNGHRRFVCRPARPRNDAAFWLWRCEGPRCGWWHRRHHRWHD